MSICLVVLQSNQAFTSQSVSSQENTAFSIVLLVIIIATCTFVLLEIIRKAIQSEASAKDIVPLEIGKE
jgi:hypothetical protein